MFPRKLYPGQKLTASETNDLQRAVHVQGNVTGSGQATTAQTATGTVIRDNTPERIHGRITGSPTGSVYPWVEVAWNSVGSAWVDISGWPGRGGTAASGGARELAGRTDVPTNSIVQLTPLPGGGGWGFGWGQTSTLTTGNVGDSGAQDSTTTLLRFNEATRIRVTRGATAGDPDIVSINGTSATMTGLTVPGTMTAGVMTATRDLPALPRAWVVIDLPGSLATVLASGGAAATFTTLAIGRYAIQFAGAPVNFAHAVMGYNNSAGGGTVMGGFTTANTLYIQSQDAYFGSYIDVQTLSVTAFW